jgi:hypothetical protein
MQANRIRIPGVVDQILIVPYLNIFLHSNASKNSYTLNRLKGKITYSCDKTFLRKHRDINRGFDHLEELEQLFWIN